MTNQQINSIVPDPSIANPSFLYYLLKDKAPAIASTASGAATPIINKSAFAGIRVSIPDLPTQEAIAERLGVLDDLIENNRRRVGVLENMAHAIYREWFVHFRYPDHETAIFVDSPLGPIPRGWDVGTVEDLCSLVQAGGTPRRSEASFWSDAEIDWYKTGDLTGSIAVGSSERISSVAIERSTARLFPAETILMAIYGSPTVGRLGLLDRPSSANQAALGLLADPTRTSTEHLWFVLAGLGEYLNQIAQGAAQQNVSKAKVAAAPVIIPSAAVVRAFTEGAGPPWRLSHKLVRENQRLAAVRDLLLPRLVAGQIDVSAISLDGLVESAVA